MNLLSLNGILYKLSVCEDVYYFDFWLEGFQGPRHGRAFEVKNGEQHWDVSSTVNNWKSFFAISIYVKVRVTYFSGFTSNINHITLHLGLHVKYPNSKPFKEI